MSLHCIPSVHSEERHSLQQCAGYGQFKEAVQKQRQPLTVPAIQACACCRADCNAEINWVADAKLFATLLQAFWVYTIFALVACH